MQLIADSEYNSKHVPTQKLDIFKDSCNFACLKFVVS